MGSHKEGHRDRKGRGICEGKSIEITPAAFIEEPKVIYDSITVMPGPAPETEGTRRAAITTANGAIRIDSGEQETEFVDPQILLQEAASGTRDGRIGGASSGAGTSSAESTHRTSARAGKGTFTTKKFTEEDFSKPEKIRVAKMARNIDPNDEDEPVTVREAVSHPTRGKQWEKAIQDEVNSLIKNHTWDLVPRPQNRQVVSNKFAFKHKKDERAIIVRLKAKLVARGFSQIYGIDYLDTYAPVVKLASIRILLAIAAIFDWKFTRWTL